MLLYCCCVHSRLRQRGTSRSSAASGLSLEPSRLDWRSLDAPLLLGMYEQLTRSYLYSGGLIG